MSAAISEADRASLLRRGIRLEYATLAWNVGEAVLVLIAAAIAHSVALAGFGLDSVLEIFASVVVIWQLTGGRPEREKVALHLIGGAFLVIALYIATESTRTLLIHAHPRASALGMASLGATTVAMVGLGIAKGRLGRRLDNPVLRTEARVTITDGYLAVSILIGLLLNATLRWWWTDPAAAFVIVFYGLKEAWEVWHPAPAGQAAGR